MLRGADIVARTLQDLGVTRIFTLSGNHIMPVFDALLSTSIQLIHARHEAACVHMADAWGRLTGEPGIALVTGGQGHGNAVAALYNALASESPLLLLSGHAPLSELGRGAFQEMAQADLARPVTKASWTAVGTLGSDIAKAIELATTGRSGPVHVSLPVDLLEQTIADESITRITKAKLQTRTSPLSPEVADQVISHLHAATKPLVICGPAMCTERGRKAMREATGALDAPVVGMESPRGINDPGLGAFVEVLAEADLVVLTGKPLDFTLRFGEAMSPSCKWIVIDPDPALIARAEKALSERLLLSAVADAQVALETLTERSATVRAKPLAWREHVRDVLAYEPPQWKSVYAKTPDRVHPVEMCRAIGSFLDKHPGATFVSDGGEIGQWAQALVKTDRRMINGVAGTIGVSLPFAIAAQLARPDHPVVAVMGDGTFGFHMAEFDTAVRYDLPIIVVVGNDARWNAEYQIQLRQYGAERAKNCDLLPSRYDRVAEALGGFGVLVSTAADLPDALDRAYLSRKPSCINVMIESVAAPIIRR
jgi:acetolactate synthase-1/2/3 large subunit